MNPQSYIDIAGRLRSKVPGIKTIDLYNAQYDDPAQHNAYACPAVFIEWLPVEWHDFPDGLQHGEGGFRIHCVIHSLLHTRNIDLLSPPQQSQHTAHLLFPAAVHAALQGFSPHACGPLRRVLSVPDHRFSGNIIIIHQYHAPVLDASALHTHLLVPVHDFPTSGHLSP